jgi:hypothetical protein
MYKHQPYVPRRLELPRLAEEETLIETSVSQALSQADRRIVLRRFPRVVRPKVQALLEQPDRRRVLALAGAMVAAGLVPTESQAVFRIFERLASFIFSGTLRRVNSENIGAAIAQYQRAAASGGLLEWALKLSGVLWGLIGLEHVGVIPNTADLVAKAKTSLKTIYHSVGQRVSAHLTVADLPAAAHDRVLHLSAAAVSPEILGAGVSEARLRANPPTESAVYQALVPAGRALDDWAANLVVPRLGPGEHLVTARCCEVRGSRERDLDHTTLSESVMRLIVEPD